MTELEKKLLKLLQEAESALFYAKTEGDFGLATRLQVDSAYDNIQAEMSKHIDFYKEN